MNPADLFPIVCAAEEEIDNLLGCATRCRDRLEPANRGAYKSRRARAHRRKQKAAMLYARLTARYPDEPWKEDPDD